MNLEKAVVEYIEASCEELKRDLIYSDINNKICGGGEDSKFTFEGKEYDVSITAFWEKSDWYEASVTGHGVNLKFDDNF